MRFTPLIIGLICTALLVTLLSLSRQSPVSNEPLLELTPVEILTLDPPPPPPDAPPPPEPQSPPPPPAPALDLPLQTLSIEAPEMPLSLEKVPLSLAVESFHLSSAPAALPSPAPAAPRAKQTTPRKPSKKTKPSPPPRRLSAPKTLSKSYYDSRELDSKPRQRSVGKYTWPRGVKGPSASVKLLIEINPSGRVKVIRTISSSNPALNAAAIKVATGSRFTTPKYQGNPVKARFYKTYILKK